LSAAAEKPLQLAVPAHRRRDSGLDWSAKLVLGAGIVAAAYLIAPPLFMLLFTAFRGPADYLPFEPGATWTVANIVGIYSDTTLYRDVIPTTLVFAVGAVALGGVIAFTLAWLAGRADRHAGSGCMVFADPHPAASADAGPGDRVDIPARPYRRLD
jgi:iron(III) transport system permease protein